MTAYVLAAVLIALAFGLVGSWGNRRWWMVGLAAAFYGSAGYVIWAVYPGPMPYHLSLKSGEAELVGTIGQPGRAIYIWVIWPGDTVPRAYSLPWRDETMEQIEAAKEQAEQGNERVVAGFPGGTDEPESGGEPGIADLFSGSEMFNLEMRPPPEFYAAPWPANPPKLQEDRTPMFEFPEANG